MSRAARAARGGQSPSAFSVETAARLRLAVTRLGRLLRRQDEGGLAPTLAASLATIARDGPMTLGELAAHEQVAPPTTTRVVNLLEEQGLVRRRHDRDDRRVCRVEVSAKGKRQLETNRRRRVAWLAGRLDELPVEQLAGLDDALGVLERLTEPGPQVPR